MFLKFTYILAAALFSALGNIFLKYASQDKDYYEIIFNWYFFLGVIFFGINLLFYSLALQKIPVSIGYPMLASLSILFVAISGYFFFGENMSLIYKIGIIVVIIGICILGYALANE